jgi:tryptophanyl-tRNA synthetase
MKALTGIQPTNILHIGNYFGALRPAVLMQEEHDLHMMIVDLHAITVEQEPENLRKNILLAAATYLAAGIEPTKTLLFQQSRIAEHSELAWVLQTLTYIGEAERMTQFKDKAGKKMEKVGVGLFTYPILMAADILLYGTEIVPVGEDQKQHLELARDLAARFNKRFGETFVVPKPEIRKEGARIRSLIDPAKKMSKSDPSAKAYISLLDDELIIRKKIMSAVTDSEAEINANPERLGLYNLLTIMSQCTLTSTEDLASHYRNSGMKRFKEDLAEILLKEILPLQAKIHSHLEHDEQLIKIIRDGSDRARKIARSRMDLVKDRIGLTI